MSIPTGTNKFGNIVYNNKSYALRSAPFNDDEAEKYSKLYAENKCTYAIKPGGIFNNFNYLIEENKIYITSVLCNYVEKSNNTEKIQNKGKNLKTGEEYLPRLTGQQIKVFEQKDILYEVFDQKEKVFVSWYSGELILVKSMLEKGTTHYIYEYIFLILTVDNGILIDNYEKKETVQGLRKLQNYIEE